jgi:hypothetical protein
MIRHGGHKAGVDEAVLLTVMVLNPDAGLKVSPLDNFGLNLAMLDEAPAVVGGKEGCPPFGNLFHPPTPKPFSRGFSSLIQRPLLLTSAGKIDKRQPMMESDRDLTGNLTAEGFQYKILYNLLDLRTL